MRESFTVVKGAVTVNRGCQVAVLRLEPTQE